MKAPTLCRLVIFALLTTAFCYAGIIRSHPIAGSILAAVITLVVFVLFERWRGSADHRELAFQDWLDRAAAVARQYDIFITGDTEHVWRERFRDGLTPIDAVREERTIQEEEGDA